MRISDGISDMSSSDLDGREDAAGNGDKAGVDEPDDRRAEMGIPRGVGDQRLIDVIAGWLPQKTEAEGLSQLLQVRHGIHRKERDEEEDAGDNEELRQHCTIELVRPNLPYDNAVRILHVCGHSHPDTNTHTIPTNHGNALRVPHID